MEAVTRVVAATLPIARVVRRFLSAPDLVHLQCTCGGVAAVSPAVTAATSAGGCGARVRRRWLTTSAASVAT